MPEQWHVDPDLWRSYAAGALGPDVEMSIDLHVTGCPTCRRTAGELAPAGAADEVWASVRNTVTAPRLARPLRRLTRALPEHELVLLGAADAVMLPWITAIGAALACALISGNAGVHDQVSFFALAPLVPVLAVVAAFDATDSMREMARPTPYSKLRLALLRTAAALTVALPLTAVAGAVVPGLHAFAFAWVLPGLVLVAAALVLLSRWRPWPVAGALSAAWLVVVLALNGTDNLAVATSAAAQLALVPLCLALCLLFLHRAASARPPEGAF